MKLKITLLSIIILISTLGVTGCKSNGNESSKGEPTELKFSIRQTYGLDSNATTQEMEIERIDVFIYRQDISLETHQTLSIANDFDKIDDGEYVLKDDKLIQSKTGRNYIYVAANFPADLVSEIKASHPKKALTVANTEALITAGFAMFSSKVTVADLVADSSDPANEINVALVRVLSKVAVFKGSQIGVPSHNVTTGVGAISDLHFGVCNMNTEFYALPKFTADMKSYEDPNWTSVDAGDLYKSPTLAGYHLMNESGVAAKDASKLYMLENTSENILQNESTYVSIYGEFVPTNIVKLSTPGDGSSTLIPDTDLFTSGSDFYTVTVLGIKSFFAKAADAADYSTAKGVAAVKFTNGRTFYKVFLNSNIFGGFGNKYDVIRNNFFIMNVESIGDLGDNDDSDVGPDPIVTPINIDVEVAIQSWVEEFEMDVELD